MPDAPSLDAVGESLGRKVGPLPAWVWATIAVAGVTAAIVIRNRLAGGNVGEPAEPAGETGTDDLADYVSPGPFLPGGFVVGGGPAQASGNGANLDLAVTPSGPTTNSDWQVIAQRFLLGRGYQGTIVSDALSRYLSGRELTQQGQAVVDAAIAGVGGPPQPVPPPTVAPSPEPVPSPGGGGSVTPAPKKPAPKKPAPKKPAPKYYTATVSGGMTLWSMARRIMGRTPTDQEMLQIARDNNLQVTYGAMKRYNVRPPQGTRIRIPITPTTPERFKQ